MDAAKNLADLKAKQNTKREELRRLASEKAKIFQKKSVTEEQIAQADLRLPQIEAEKKAAAASKVCWAIIQLFVEIGAYYSLLFVSTSHP